MGGGPLPVPEIPPVYFEKWPILENPPPLSVDETPGKPCSARLVEQIIIAVVDSSTSSASECYTRYSSFQNPWVHHNFDGPMS